MNENAVKGKVISLQALRAFAFLGIFLSHAGSPVRWGFLGVSIFLVLSGFLMIYKYGNKSIVCSIKENIAFSLRKIKKLYLLHIITMCLAVLLTVMKYTYMGWTLKRIVYLIGTIGLNVTLLQTWVPHSRVNSSLNGVAWYLSATMFLYFMFPYVKKWIANKKNSTLMAICFALFVIEIVVCVPWIYFLGSESPIYIWFMYCFPIFRLGDFFVGCCLGKWYSEKELRIDLSFVKSSVLEILATVITVFVYLWIKQNHENVFLLAINNFTTLYIALAVMWILLFAYNKGIITKILTNRVTIFVGNISAYTFLIHYVITLYVSCAKKFLDVEFAPSGNAFLIIVEFLLTVIATLLYMKIRKKIENNTVVLQFKMRE